MIFGGEKLRKKIMVSIGAVLFVVLILANLGYLNTLAQDTNRLAVIEDEEGNKIAVEPINDEVWNKLVDLFHSGERMWIGGELEEFINIQPDKYYRWGFRFKPGTINVAQVTAEGLQTSIKSISENLNYWMDVGQAYVFAKVTDYFTGDEIQILGHLSSSIIKTADKLTISALVKDDDGNPLEGATVTATIGDLEILFLLQDHGNGNYQGTINASIVNEGTYKIVITAQKEGYKPDQTSLILTVTSSTLGGIVGTVTDWDGNSLTGMRVGIVSGTTFFPEIAVVTNGEGYYQIGSVPPGTFEVAVHDRQGKRVGLGSVTVRSGETTILNFVIESAPLDVTSFTAVVNGMKSLNISVCVNLNDGLTEKEAELIVGTAFIKIKGDYLTHRLDTLIFDDSKIEAHYTWGIDENDMGHIFDVTADPTTFLMTVTYCR